MSSSAAPRVRAICSECRQTFEVRRDGETSCPACDGGRLDADARAAWSAAMAGYSDGWRLAAEGAPPERWREAIARRRDGHAARYIAGLTLARRKHRAYIEAGLPRGRPATSSDGLRLPGL